MTAAVHQPVQQAESAGDDVTLSVAALQHEVAGLREAMASRAQIEQAKGMLMLRYRIDENRAFLLLRKWSSVHNVKLRVVAAALVEAWLSEPTLVGSGPEPSHLLAGALDGPAFA